MRPRYQHPTPHCNVPDALPSAPAAGRPHARGKPGPGVIARSTLFAALVALITPPYAAAAWLVLPLPARTRYRIVTSWSHVVIALARVVCGMRYEIRGGAPSGGPYVVLSKHQSAWETLAFQVLLPPQVLVLKRGLLWLPFFGWGLATLSPITVKRGAPGQTLRRLLEQGQDRLAQGFWIVIFPEGTRVRPGERAPYQAGGAWLACRTGVPVVPIAHNAGELWGRNSFLKYPGTVVVSIGEPIASAGRKPHELNTQVEHWIEAEMARLGAQGAAVSPQPARV